MVGYAPDLGYMRRDPHIPLFLWVATALVVHALGGGGATEAARVLEERLDIRGFAELVTKQARLGVQPTEVTLLEEQMPEPEPLDPSHEGAEAESTEQEVDATDPPSDQAKNPAELDRPEAPKDKKEQPQVEPTQPEPRKEAPPQPKEEKPEEKHPAETQEPPLEALLDDRRVAVVQHTEDTEQKDNPNARFAAEHANHVKEETRARITANDHDAAEPTPASGGKDLPDPGNAERTKVAQSEQVEGQKDRVQGDAGPDTASEQPRAAAATSLPTPRQGQQAEARALPASPSQASRAASQARQGQAEPLSSDFGRFSMPPGREARRAQAGRPALPGRKGTRPEELLGYGSQGVTERGVNLNLSHAAAQAMTGADEIARMRQRAGEKRLSQHRGSFQNMGIEKWRPALENYVATVKPGNQTALNTAHVPFAGYLNQIHQRLHEVFADGFLASLESLPPDHPLSDQDMSTHVEIALSREDGRIVRMGITKSSGVTMFDVGALESVKKAAPYGVPPGSIISSDGNVYLHWEFHRRLTYACSTYFARPFILNIDQKQTPPRVEPPPRKDYDDKPADERSGSNAKSSERPARPG